MDRPYAMDEREREVHFLGPPVNQVERERREREIERERKLGMEVTFLLFSFRLRQKNMSEYIPGDGGVINELPWNLERE